MRVITKTIYHASHLLRHFGVRFNEEFDPRVIAMKKIIQQAGGQIEFTIEQYPDGSWTAESKNLDGIFTGGTGRQQISSTIKDAIFTYFSIPPHLCNDTLLRKDNEPVTLTQRVYV